MINTYMKELPNGFRLFRCGVDRAQECMTMRDEILEENALADRSCWYVCDETDDEFRGFFVDKISFALGIDAPDGRLAGCGVVSFRPTALEMFREFIPKEEFDKDRNVGYVEMIQVQHDFRGRGFQRVFFAELERFLLDQGATYSTGIVSPYNVPSRSNFVKMGYREVGQFVCRPSGYERLKMVKKLSVRQTDVPTHLTSFQ